MMAAFYRRFGLNERQIDLLAESVEDSFAVRWLDAKGLTEAADGLAMAEEQNLIVDTPKLMEA